MKNSFSPITVRMTQKLRREAGRRARDLKFRNFSEYVRSLVDADLTKAEKAAR